MSLFGQLRDALTVKRALDRVRKEIAMGHAKPALFGLASAIATATVASITVKYPCVLEMLKEWPTLLTAGVLAGLGVYLKSPKEEKLEAKLEAKTEALKDAKAKAEK